MSKGRRKRVAAAAAKLLPDGAAVEEVVVGRANTRWSTGAIVTITCFFGVFVIGLIAGRLLVPGLLFIALFAHFYRPPRLTVVSPNGVAVMETSLLNGEPTKTLALLPHNVLWNAGRKVQLGPDVVSFSAKELERLGAAQQRLYVTQPGGF